VYAAAIDTFHSDKWHSSLT